MDSIIAFLFGLTIGIYVGIGILALFTINKIKHGGDQQNES